MKFASASDEAEYQAQLAVAIRGQHLLGLLVATPLVAGTWFVDQYFFVPGALDATRAIRFGTLIPLLAVGFALHLLPHRTFAKTWEIATAAIAAGTPVAAAMVTFMFVSRGHPITDRMLAYGLVSVLISVLGFHSAFGLGFVVASVATVSSTLCYVGYFFVIGDPHQTNTFVAFWALGANGIAMISSYSLERFRRRDFLLRKEIERLLLNVLPAPIAERLKAKPDFIADGFPEATVLFADIVGFTDLAAKLSPQQVVEMLNRLFTGFDALAAKHGLEKIKTIGDAYMVVGGIPAARADHTEAVADMALAMRDVVAACATDTGHKLEVRIGIHLGPVVAGVIGTKKFAYDLWGDAVNTASRMESHGLAGEIQVSDAVRARLAPTFGLRERGAIQVKGKGEMNTWFLDRRLL